MDKAFSGIKFLDNVTVSIEEIKFSQHRLLNEISGLKDMIKNKGHSLEYVTEKEASQILSKKSTWFFNMRKAGLLPYSKVGGKVFYSKKDLERLIEIGKSEH